MLPSKLWHNLQKKHPDLKDKPPDFSRERATKIFASKKTMTTRAKTYNDKIPEVY